MRTAQDKTRLSSPPLPQVVIRTTQDSWWTHPHKAGLVLLSLGPQATLPPPSHPALKTELLLNIGKWVSAPQRPWIRKISPQYLPGKEEATARLLISSPQAQKKTNPFLSNSL